MGLELIVITLGSFAASFINGALATGGIYIILAASSSVFPLAIAIPLQSAFVFASLVARIALFYRAIVWPIVIVFVLGCFVGVAVGANLFTLMSEGPMAMVLGLLLLLMIWMPAMSMPTSIKQPFLWIGMVHGAIGTIFGVGAILQPAVLRTKLGREQITGTLAACLLALDVLKVSSYTLMGFQYQDYIVHIILASMAGFLGTWVGRKAASRISEERFRMLFRLLVTLIALRLLVRGLILVVGS